MSYVNDIAFWVFFPLLAAGLILLMWQGHRQESRRHDASAHYFHEDCPACAPDPRYGTEVGWDGCTSCYGCLICSSIEGDCCVDCTYECELVHTRAHDYCPTCHCDGGTVGRTYSNRVCNCEGHECNAS